MYLTIECASPTCHAIYRAYRIIERTKPIDPNDVTQDYMIHYCMFCSSPHISITQDHEYDVIESLARRYNRTIQEIQEIISLYHNLPRGVTLTFQDLVAKK